VSTWSCVNCGRPNDDPAERCADCEAARPAPGAPRGTVLLGAVPAPRSDAATDRLAQAETNPGAAAPPPRVAVTAPPDVSLVPRQRPRQATVAINLDEVPDLEPQAASPDAGTALDDAPTTPALRSASRRGGASSSSPARRP
jgi:hypothetical protein